MTSQEIIQRIHNFTNSDLVKNAWPNDCACGDRETLDAIRKAARSLREKDIARKRKTEPSNWSWPEGKREVVDELSYALSSLANYQIDELSEEDVQACLNGALVMCLACSDAGLNGNYEIAELEKKLCNRE